MELLRANLKFVSRGSDLHPIDQVKGQIFHAYSRHYLVAAYAIKQNLTFYVYSTLDVNVRGPLSTVDPVYAFRFNNRLQRIIHREEDAFPNRLQLPSFQQSLLQTHLITAYRNMANDDWGRKIEDDSPSTSVNVQEDKAASWKLMIEKLSMEAENQVNLPRKIEPKNASLSGKRLKVLTEAIYLKESVLECIHLLNAADRNTYRNLWEEFETWMSKFGTGKELAVELNNSEDSFALQSIFDIRDRLGVLYDNAVTERIKPKESIAVHMLLAEIQQLNSLIRSKPELLDVVSTHQLETVSNDCTKLIDLYHQASADAQPKLEPNVVEGLNEAVRKLKEIDEMRLSYEQRNIERQVLIMKER